MASSPKPYLTHDSQTPSARNAALEAQIRATPDDTAAYLVYADWLSTQGDPRGELAMIQHQLLAADYPRSADLREREAELLKANGGFLGGVNPALAAVGWHLGMWRELKIHNDDWMDDAFDPRAVARRLFDLPQASALSRLALGVLRWEYQAVDVPAVLEEAAASTFAETLRELHLGDVSDLDIDNAHHSIGDIGIVSRAFPRLERLKVWGYEIASGAEIDLPALEELSIQTCGLSRELFDRIVAGRLPRLRKLDLWFGTENYNCQVGVSDLSPILEGTALSSVTQLGLRNAEITNSIVDQLVDSKVLARLERLDLSLGTLDDTGAEVLLNNAVRWRHLVSLDVDASYLTDAALERLRQVGPEILGGGQRDDEGDPDYRYPAVAE